MRKVSMNILCLCAISLIFLLTSPTTTHATLLTTDLTAQGVPSNFIITSIQQPTNTPGFGANIFGSFTIPHDDNDNDDNNDHDDPAIIKLKSISISLLPHPSDDDSSVIDPEDLFKLRAITLEAYTKEQLAILHPTQHFHADDDQIIRFLTMDNEVTLVPDTTVFILAEVSLNPTDFNYTRWDNRVIPFAIDITTTHPNTTYSFHLTTTLLSRTMIDDLFPHTARGLAPNMFIESKVEIPFAKRDERYYDMQFFPYSPSTNNPMNLNTSRLELVLAGPWVGHLDEEEQGHVAHCFVNGEIFSNLEFSVTHGITTFTIHTTNNTKALYIPHGFPIAVRCFGAVFRARITPPQDQMPPQPTNTFRNPYDYGTMFLTIYDTNNTMMDVVVNDDFNNAVLVVNTTRLPSFTQSAAALTIAVDHEELFPYRAARTFRLVYPQGTPNSLARADYFWLSEHLLDRPTDAYFREHREAVSLPHLKTSSRHYHPNKAYSTHQIYIQTQNDDLPDPKTPALYWDEVFANSKKSAYSSPTNHSAIVLDFSTTFEAFPPVVDVPSNNVFLGLMLTTFGEKASEWVQLLAPRNIAPFQLTPTSIPIQILQDSVYTPREVLGNLPQGELGEFSIATILNDTDSGVHFKVTLLDDFFPPHTTPNRDNIAQNNNRTTYVLRLRSRTGGTAFRAHNTQEKSICGVWSGETTSPLQPTTIAHKGLITKSPNARNDVYELLELTFVDVHVESSPFHHGAKLNVKCDDSIFTNWPGGNEMRLFDYALTLEQTTTITNLTTGEEHVVVVHRALFGAVDIAMWDLDTVMSWITKIFIAFIVLVVICCGTIMGMMCCGRMPCFHCFRTDRLPRSNNYRDLEEGRYVALVDDNNTRSLNYSGY